MDSKDYEIILNALKLVKDIDENTEKLIKKIKLFIESDKVRTEYQEKMEKISKDIQSLIGSNSK